MAVHKVLSNEEKEQLLKTLKMRFENNMHRHEDITWEQVEQKLEENPEKLWSLFEMERTGGEPDVIGYEDGKYLFCDCSKETPKGRRSICYDREALEARKSISQKIVQ